MDPTNYIAQYQLYADQFGQARAQGRKGRRGRAFPESKRERVCMRVYMQEGSCVMGKDADGEGYSRMEGEWHLWTSRMQRPTCARRA
jgi:hypothetical protein